MIFLSHFSFRKLLRSTLSALLSHFRLLYLDLDPVKDATIYGVSKEQLLDEIRFSKERQEVPENSGVHLSYLLPLLTLLFIVVDSVFVFQRNGWQHQAQAMPELFSHRIMPQVVWKLGDVMVFLSMIIPTFIYGNLLFDRTLERKYVMFLFVDTKNNGGGKKKGVQIIENGKPLPAEESTAIYAYRKKVLIFLAVTVLNTTLFISTLLFWCLFQEWRGSFHDYLLLVITGLFIFYVQFSNILMILYFCVTTTRYLRIKLRFKTAALQKLAAEVRRKKRRKTDYRRKTFSELWTTFGQLHLQMVEFFSEIGGHHRFWSKYLTVYFAFFTVEICYFAFILFFVVIEEKLLAQCLNFIGAEFLLLLLYVTWQSSRILYQSGRMHRQAVQLALKMGQSAGGSRKGFSLADHLKVNRMEDNHRSVATQSCFHLVTGQQINSKMFEMLFSYISLVFMMVFKNHKKQ